MSDTPENEPKEDIPAFKITPKTVDESWKEEARRDREQLAARVCQQVRRVPATPTARQAGGTAGAPGTAASGRQLARRSSACRRLKSLPNNRRFRPPSSNCRNFSWHSWAALHSKR